MNNSKELIQRGKSAIGESDRDQVARSDNYYEALRQEIVGGLLYCHDRANTNTGKVLEVTSFAYALIELLTEKGLLTIEELDVRKKIVGKRLAEKLKENGMGVMLQQEQIDKYQFPGGVKIDCENRVHLCKAACCRMDFALSKQDVEEGIVKWELSRPYLIAKDQGGYCRHLDRCASRCAVYQHRPVPCRGYDCRNDKRIWEDFEQKIINPDLEKVFQGHSAEPVASQHGQEGSL
jgi:Fe-S-cluster containining protein